MPVASGRACGGAAFLNQQLGIDQATEEFGQFYTAQWPAVARFFAQTLGDSLEGEDLAEQVFLKLFQVYVADCDDVTRARRLWQRTMWATARNLVRDLFRRRSRAARVYPLDAGGEEEEEGVITAVDESPGPDILVLSDEEAAEQHRLWDAYTAALGALSDEEWLCYEFFAEGLSRPQIAEKSGLTDSQVKERIDSGRRKVIGFLLANRHPCVEQLSERERRVVETYCRGRTFGEIAKQFEVNRGEAADLVHVALRRILECIAGGYSDASF